MANRIIPVTELRMGDRVYHEDVDADNDLLVYDVEVRVASSDYFEDGIEFGFSKGETYVYVEFNDDQFRGGEAEVFAATETILLREREGGLWAE